MIVLMCVVLSNKPLQTRATGTIVVGFAIAMAGGFKSVDALAKPIVMMAMWNKVMHQHADVGKQYGCYR